MMNNGIDEVIERVKSANTEAQPFATKGRRNDPSSQNRILIKGGRCVNDDQMFDADVFIEDGIIKQVGPHLIVPGGVRVVEAKGYYVFPGGIDPHTHFQLPFMGTRSIDDFYSGTKAALAGGTTFVIDFVISPQTNLLDGYQQWRNWADEKVCCDYGLHVAITKWNDKTKSEIETLVKERGVNSFKFFTAYKEEGMMLRDEEIINLLDACKSFGALPMVHAENGDIIEYLKKKLLRLGITGPEGHVQARSEEAEAEAIHRCITLANQVGAPIYVVHISSKSGADEVSRAKRKGNVVIGETLAANIGTDGTHYFNRCWRHAAAHVMAPPLRADNTTGDHLVNLLSSSQLDVLASDHCVFTSKQKALGEHDFTKIPCGVNGVEERLMILWEKGVKTGKLDPCQFVALTSSNAARIFNCYPRKGRIAVGSDADIVVWGKKPKVIKAETHHSLVDFNVFEGIMVEHSPHVVIAGGKIALDEDGDLHVIQGSGRYIPLHPFANSLFSKLVEKEINLGPIKVDRSGKVEMNDKHDKQDFKKPYANLSIETQINSVKTRNEVTGTPPLTGPPSPALSTVSSASSFYRQQTKSGVRNLQDSSFKFSGEQIDDDRASRTGIKVQNPPGGRSQGIW